MRAGGAGCCCPYEYDTSQRGGGRQSKCRAVVGNRDAIPSVVMRLTREDGWRTNYPLTSARHARISSISLPSSPWPLMQVSSICRRLPRIMQRQGSGQGYGCRALFKTNAFVPHVRRSAVPSLRMWCNFSIPATWHGSICITCWPSTLNKFKRFIRTVDFSKFLCVEV